MPDGAVLTRAQRDTFDRDGLVVLDDVVDDETIEAIVGGLSDLYGQPHHTRDGVVYYRNRIQDAWRLNDSVRALALAPRALAPLEDLYGRRPLPFQTINFRTGTQQAAHSDAIHFNTIPPGYMAGVWVALEDMNLENGPLVYYPGSHKLPYIQPPDIGLQPKWDHYDEYVRFVADQMAQHGFEPRYGTIEKGQALVWAANLVHGGAKQEDRSRSRHSQVTHYFFEGCEYYAPMVSDEGNLRRLDPVWIA
jgi:ectoine hydroxylase-related dioxygenase (phytanoyl-CoA dioxygenase family)